MRRRSQAATPGQFLIDEDEDRRRSQAAKTNPEEPRIVVESLDTDDDDDEGDAITVTAGRELFAPIRYHSFEVGPFALQTHVRAGESRHDAIKRAQATVDELFAQDFERKLQEHLERIKAAGRAAMEARIVVK